MTLTAVAGGTATVTAQASDPAGLSVTQSFTVSVTGQANSAPSAVGTIPAQTVTVGKAAATVDVTPYFSDPGDTLTYTAISSATSKATVSVSGATVSITAGGSGDSDGHRHSERRDKLRYADHLGYGECEPRPDSGGHNTGADDERRWG